MLRSLLVPGSVWPQALLQELAGLRVIAGSLKGRRLKAPDWEGLRPTSDKVRETLFNILAPRIAGARVLDAFAGTGALGIEALSRGASAVTFIEQDRRAQALIGANLAQCGIHTGYNLVRGAVDRAVATLQAPGLGPFDIVLLDPPYALPGHTALMKIDALVAPGGVAVLEHAKRSAAPEQVGRLVRVRQVVSGDSMLDFYEVR
jgi:16S rRNA (guanine(966)-N(2))-methyltransferase RsmD